MKLKNLTLIHFRNIQELNIQCDSRINFYVGKNAQGKTSLLEAIHLLSALRSFRTLKTEDFIQEGEPRSEISCEISGAEYGDNLFSQLKIIFEKDRGDNFRFKKTASINGKIFKSSSHYLNEKFIHPLFGFQTIVFNPSDHDLVRGDPKVRRLALNSALSAQDQEYFQVLRRYERVLLQRNALLKTREYKTHLFSEELFYEYTEQLIHYGAKIAQKRLIWLNELNEVFNEVTQEISPLKNKIYFNCLGYFSSWLFEQEIVKFTGHFECPSIHIIEEKLRCFLKVNRAREFRSLTTAAGPHKDDFLFFLRDHSLKSFGSQGEVRTALLAFKLSEVKIYQNKTKTLPLFLLDDFSSELDEERRNLLLEKLLEMDVQTFVTTTDRYFLKKEYPSFYIQNGQISEINNEIQYEPQNQFYEEIKKNGELFL